MNDIKANSNTKAKRVSPCFNCPDRGKEFCHHDDCPHGWKEYQEYVQKIRAERLRKRQGYNLKNKRDHYNYLRKKKDRGGA